MITEQDLQAAIAECLGERNPNANTCIKLAAFYTIRDQLFPDKTEPQPERFGYSFASPPEPVENKIDYESDSEFGQLIRGRDPAEIWPVMDELMQTVQVLNPRLYSSVLRKIQ